MTTTNLTKPKLMAILTLLGALVATAGTHSPTFPNQEEASPKESSRQDADDDKLTSADLRIEHFDAGSDAQGVYRAASKILGRSIRVFEDGGMRVVPNLHQFGSAIIVYETPDNIRRIVADLERIARTQRQTGPTPEAEALETVVVELAHISPQEALRGISSLTRNISGFEQRQNVTALKERGALVIRDVAKRRREIMDVLNRLDVRKPQVTIECLFVRGLDEGETDSRLPEELTSNLGRLTRHSAFTLLSSGMARATPGNGQKVAIDMQGQQGHSSRTSFFPVAFDGKSVTLDDLYIGVRQGKTEQSVKTSTNVPVNRYTVIGAFGDETIYAVLRLVP